MTASSVVAFSSRACRSLAVGSPCRSISASSAFARARACPIGTRPGSPSVMRRVPPVLTRAWTTQERAPVFLMRSPNPGVALSQ
jgi:hypothetical protein